MIKKYKNWLIEVTEPLTEYKEIKNFLEAHKIKNYSIRSNGIVDVNGDVNLNESYSISRIIRMDDNKYKTYSFDNLTFLPVKFGVVKGSFECSFYKKLQTLEGAPKKCNYFSCSGDFETFEGAPEECKVFYCCSNNNLKTLKGAPHICDKFTCSKCKNLKSLEGAPKECKEFNCFHCNSLKSLEGAPKECKIFNCSFCKNLESLKGAPEKCEDFDCSGCKNLESLEGAPKECKGFDCMSCLKLKSLKGSTKTLNNFNCSYCKSLEYTLNYFPRCKYINVYGSSFDFLYDMIGERLFIELINTENNFKFEKILASIYVSNNLNFNTHIQPLLKNEIITEKEFRNKHRGIIAGIEFNI